MPFDDTRQGEERRGGGGRRNSDDIAAVLFFLRGAAEAGQRFNAHSGREAFDAFARLLDQDPGALWDRTGQP